jgi:hypothetical protein
LSTIIYDYHQVTASISETCTKSVDPIVVSMCTRPSGRPASVVQPVTEFGKRVGDGFPKAVLVADQQALIVQKTQYLQRRQRIRLTGAGDVA